MEVKSTPWVSTDNGIDPNGGIFDKERVNEKIQDQTLAVSCLANTLFCLTFPVSCCFSWEVVSPMKDTIVTQCGVVKQILRKPGLYMINPFCTTTYEVEMQLKNMEIKGMGANDLFGSPLVASAQFIYRVTDSLSVKFKTKSLDDFLKTQAESSLRVVLAHYPYDDDKDHQECLRKHSEKIDNHLKTVLQGMVAVAGIKIESFQLFSIGYDPKMERLLLARQEALAEVTARRAIAEGTSGIIEETLTRLKTLGIELDASERNRFATNLTMILVNHGQTSLNIFDQPSVGKMEKN